MKISIVIPVYNVEKFLMRCVDSILNQTYENFELILVDDGSTDDCGKMCDEMAITDSRIKVFHKQNGGISSARNLGIRKASGEYVLLVDGDDSLFGNKALQELVELAQKYDSPDMVVGDVKLIGFKPGQKEECSIKTVNIPEYTRQKRQIKKLMLHDYAFVPVWNRLIKKSLILQHNLFFEGTIIEDDLWSFMASKHISTLALLHSPTYCYYHNESGITFSNKNFEKRKENFQRVIETMSKNIDDFCKKQQLALIRSNYHTFVFYFKKRITDIETVLGKGSHDLLLEKMVASRLLREKKSMTIITRILLKSQLLLVGKR